MTITAALILFSVTWFMTLFCVLPFRTQSQDEANHIVPGTPASAPAGDVMKRKVLVTTLIATPIWAVITFVILSGWITIEDLDWFNRMKP